MSFAVRTLGNGLHWIPGIMPANVLFKPDIANCYIIEDGNDVIIIDTGSGVEFRKTLRRFFAGRRYGAATLVNTHFHPDHVSNNVVFDEIDAGRKAHYIHPASEPVVDLVGWIPSEARRAAAQDYWVVALDGPLPLRLMGAGARRWVRRWPDSAFRYLFPVAARFNLQKYKPRGTRSRSMLTLRPADREALRVGSQTFEGWRIGQLLLIDDYGHTDDSMSIYHTGRKLLLTGDLTLQDNPLWPSGTYGRMLANLRAFQMMVDEGKVACFGDGHMTEVITDQAAISAYFGQLITDHERRRAAVLAVAREHGLTSVDAVRDILVVENPEFALLSRSGEWPMAYRWTRAIVALALREADIGVTPAPGKSAATTTSD